MLNLVMLLWALTYIDRGICVGIGVGIGASVGDGIGVGDTKTFIVGNTGWRASECVGDVGGTS